MILFGLRTVAQHSDIIRTKEGGGRGECFLNENSDKQRKNDNCFKNQDCKVDIIIVFGRYIFMLIRCFQYTAGRITLDKVTWNCLRKGFKSFLEKYKFIFKWAQSFLHNMLTFIHLGDYFVHDILCLIKQNQIIKNWFLGRYIKRTN